MEHGNRKLQYIAAFCVSIASLTLGVSSAWPTPVIHKLLNKQTDVEITEAQVSWMLAMNSPGFMAGSFVTRFVSDRFGRRTTMLASTLPFLIGAVFALTTIKAWLLYLTQFLWGTGTGMIGTVVPMYIAEISDKEIRGTLSLSTRIMFSLGNLVMMSVGPFISYYSINCLLLVLPVCYFVAIWCVPESPYYYLKDGKVEAARKELTRLKGLQNVENLELELTLIQQHVNSDMKRSSSAWELFTGKEYRRAITISAGLKIAQIMTGGQTIGQYLGRIMQESKSTLTIPTVFIVFGVVRFVVGFISTVLVDRLGRRPLLYASFFGTGVSLAIVGVYFFLQEVLHMNESTLQMFGLIPFACIIASNIISTLGYQSVVFIVPAEIFPMNVKAVALTSINIFGGVLAFITTLGYQMIKDVSGLCGVFWVFAGVAIFGAIFVLTYVPETKGKSLEEIQDILQGISCINDEEDVRLQQQNEIPLSQDIKELDVLKVSDKEKDTDNL